MCYINVADRLSINFWELWRLLFYLAFVVVFAFAAGFVVNMML